MPRNHKPTNISHDPICGNLGKYSVPSNGHRCPKSPTEAHWWVIDSPRGPLSLGVCWYCGEQRQFANTMELAVRMSRTGVKQ